MRLVASFALLFTTSGDVLCSKFGGVWETLWIFKAARWTHDRCTKINKRPTITNGVGASSFEIWTENLAQLLTVNTLTNSWSFICGDSHGKFCSLLPCRHPKTWHSDADISDLGLFLKQILCFYFQILEWKKNKKLLDYIQEHCVRKMGKIWSELKLLFSVYYWFLKLYTGIIWHSYYLCMGFHSEWAAAGLMPSGLRRVVHAIHEWHQQSVGQYPNTQNCLLNASWSRNV